jgi:signal recognition particle subunit SRP54
MVEGLSKKITDVVRQITGKANISEKNISDALNEIKIALLEADVSLRVVRRFINQTTEEALGERVLRDVAPGQQFVKIVHDKIVGLLGDKRQDLNLKGPDTHSVILLAGLQGSGKTTTASKLALFLKNKGRKPILVAADLVRPAAVEQLSVLGAQAGIEVYKEDTKDPVSLVRNGIKYAIKQSFDTIIIDTTGRLQIDEGMMSELAKIKAVSQPVETLLVADAMTGQNAVDIASEFDTKVGLTGVILTKFDSDTRGGAALSIKSITGKPIKFIGMSEKLDGLEPFYPERIASRILGMGDIVTLVEKAQETMQVEEALELQQKIEDNTFTLEDYLDQFKRMKKMGSIKSLMNMIPGMAGQIDESKIDEKELKYEESIILSMTIKERKNYRIISPSRKSRIAKGSGTSVYLINRLLKKFEKTKLMMRKMSTNKSYQSKILSQFGGIE